MKFSPLVLVFASAVLAHMEIQTPYPRKSQYSPYYQNKGDVDWDLNSPSGSEGGLDYPYPCRGSPQGPAQATYKAGDTIQVKFVKVDGSNIHNGGHCQFGLSYNNGKDIVVLSTVIKTCFLNGLTFPVTIPANAPPSDKAVLVWSWVNAEGNREYYQNCADIKITGGNPAGSVTGPRNLVGNLPGYPIFPEFYQGDRHELFDQRPIITIKP